MPNSCKSMIDNYPVFGFHHDEIGEGDHNSRKGLPDVSRQRPRVLEEILIVKALASKSKGLDDGVIGPDNSPGEGAMRRDRWLQIPLRESGHEVVQQGRGSMLKGEVGFVKEAGWEGGVSLRRGKVTFPVVNLLARDRGLNPCFRVRRDHKGGEGSHRYELTVSERREVGGETKMEKEAGMEAVLTRWAKDKQEPAQAQAKAQSGPVWSTMCKATQ